MSNKKMFSVLYLLNGKVWTIGLLSGVFIFCILGFVIDFRFFMLALIWVFLISPMVVAFLYFIYGMKPLTAFNTIPHKVKFENNKLDIEFPDLSPDSTEDKTVEIDHKKDYTLKNECPADLKYGADYVILNFKESGWLWLPINSFSNHDDLRLILDHFSTKSA